MELLVVGIVLYVVPGLIALGRGHHQRFAILALNLLLGWTFVGWVAAFVWALTATAGRRRELPPNFAAHTRAWQAEQQRSR